MNQIINSNISWKSGTPFSEQFEDFYYNSDGGIDETLHVFVNSNNIDQKFLKSKDDSFNINETGFGTGLNFYCTLQAILYASDINTNKPIYFFSSELFPLSIEDFVRTAANFPQFSGITQQIISQYPPAVKGFHRMVLNGGAIYLTLMFDDSLSAYKQCSHDTHAWLLDGFSPAKNSEMWQADLFKRFAQLSLPNITTLATFTSAGFVRRSLQEHGFVIKKHCGFGKKREMITGVFSPLNESNTQSTVTKPDASTKPWFSSCKKQRSIQRVAIIGAGLSGCTTAEALIRRGIEVTLFDSKSGICQLASGNIQGALYAKLPSKPTLGGEFHLTGLEYSLRLLNMYQCFDDVTAQQCGVLQLATNQKEQDQQQDLLNQNYYNEQVVRAVTASEASTLAGTHTPFNGLFFPRAGWVAPKLFCQKLIDKHDITLRTNSQVNRLEQLDNGHWRIHLEDQSTSNQSISSQINTHDFDAIVVANANDAKALSQLSSTSIKAIRGQVTHAQNTTNTTLNTVVCGAGYISPATNNQLCFGASFDLHNDDLELKMHDQKTNIDNLSKVLPELAATLDFKNEPCGKVAHRCSTPDYLPMVGPAPIFDQFIHKYQKLKNDKNWRFSTEPAPNYNGLFLNIGHGSKGLITCPLSAEHLVCLITNQPSPLPLNIEQAIHPARFIIKQLIRRAI